jgi:hypothetical protein
VSSPIMVSRVSLLSRSSYGVEAQLASYGLRAGDCRLYHFRASVDWDSELSEQCNLWQSGNPLGNLDIRSLRGFGPQTIAGWRTSWVAMVHGYLLWGERLLRAGTESFLVCSVSRSGKRHGNGADSMCRGEKLFIGGCRRVVCRFRSMLAFSPAAALCETKMP